MKYGRSRTLQSQKFLQKKRKKIITGVLLSILCLIIFFFNIVFLLRLPYFQISNVNIVGSDTLNNEDSKNVILSYLDGYYLYFIPKTNFLFYSKNTIKKNFLNENKKIESLEIHTKGLTSIEIDIKERIPVALVCEGFPKDSEENDISNNDNQCYFSDKNAFVYEKSPQFSNGVYFRYYINKDSNTDIIGTNFIKKDVFDSLQKFVQDIHSSKINPYSILIGNQGYYEMYYKNLDNTDTVVYFDDRISFDKTSSNLVAFLNDFNTKKKTATSTMILDSINMRFGNNIFYVTK